MYEYRSIIKCPKIHIKIIVKSYYEYLYILSFIRNELAIQKNEDEFSLI